MPAPTPDPAAVEAVDRRLAQRVGRSWRELRRGAAMGVVRDQLFGVGPDALEPGQMDTLDVLVRAPDWRMGDLADALRVDPSTATRAVDRLVRSGLAERTTCTDDKRVVRVSATAAGHARFESVAAIRAHTLQRILGHYTPEERVVLADLMERFVDALDELAGEITDGAAPSGGTSARAQH